MKSDALQLNIRHIRAFVKTYERGSLLAASKAVHMSQPAMTQAISKLEAQFDLKLFDRFSDGMSATKEAKRLYPRLKAVLDYIRSKRVTHTQLRAFLAVARGGSYAAAHQLTGLARASLHRAVSSLEAALNQKLLQRRGRGVELTDMGLLYARRYALAEAEMRLALEEIEAAKGKRGGRVAIGAMPLCRARVLPKAIIEFQKQNPECEITIAEGSYAELLEPLRNGELDFLIGALRDGDLEADIMQAPLFDDWPVVFARYDHPLKKNKIHALGALGKYEWCLPPQGVPLRDRWEEMFAHAGLALPKIRVECGSVTTIRQILMQTDCLAVLSPEQMAAEMDANWVRIVGKTTKDMRRMIGITQRENFRPSHAQSGFMQMLKQVA